MTFWARLVVIMAAIICLDSPKIARASTVQTQSQIELDGASAGIYYNLGHAAYRQNELGMAMAAFLAARDLKPRDADTLANIAFLRSKLQDQLDVDVRRSAWDSLFAWALYLSAREWLYLGAGMLALLFMVASARIVFPRRAILRGFSWSLLALLILLTPPALYRLLAAPTWGAVTHSEVAVQSGPAETGYVTLFQLHAGAPFVVLDSQGDWYKIQLSDGKKGWVANSAAQVYSL